jgi:hypothetical protein
VLDPLAEIISVRLPRLADLTAPYGVMQLAATTPGCPSL